MIEAYRARLGTEPLAPLVTELLKTIDYRSELERVYNKNAGEAEARWHAVEELVNAAALYEQREQSPTLLGFLEEATLSDRDFGDDDKRERHAVTLMTLHSAKGLEFPHVFMVGLEEGILPHQRSVMEGKGVDEERRLCYVGVTRARETLTITFSKGRMKWGKPRPCIPSRFLMEMRGDTERARKAAEASEAMFRKLGEASDDEDDGKPKKKAKAKAVLKRRI